MNIIIQVDQVQRDMYILSDDRKYKKLYLWGKAEEEYHIKDDLISETLSPWIEISILENVVERSLDISCKWYGLKPGEQDVLEDLTNQVRAAYKNSSGLSVNLNSILDMSDWVIKLY